MAGAAVEPVTGPRLDIDLEAFRHNVRLLADTIAPSQTMLAVKANAYGHGLIPLAQAAVTAGAESLAVLEVSAGLALRDAGITVPLFAWLLGIETDFAAAIDARIDLGVSLLWQVEAAATAARDTPARLHLKIDTGLHRNGARPEDWPELVSAARAAERAGRVQIVGLWSHLADASPEDDEEAVARFREAIAVAASLDCRPPLRHIAASSAGLRMPSGRFDLVRFGIAAYGISPFDDRSGRELGLRPVMAMRAPVIAVAGSHATVPLGSGDGIQVPAIGAARVEVGGHRYPIVELDIDSLTLDVGGRVVAVGDQATVFGPGDDGEPTAEEWAVWAGTIGDEIVVRAGERLPRVYRHA
jgi:alanine racemase